MDRAKKKFASAIDGLRSLHNRTEINVDEKVQSEHCRFTRVVRHGLPEDPRCCAYDPVQRLIAIGTGRGHIRIIGDAGVDYLLKHESGEPVLHMQFLVNEGGLITSCGTDSIHLWNYRQKTAEIVHTVQLSKESVSCIHLPVAGKWLFIGTDKGNVYFLCLNSFLLSPYVINWNKAIDLSCRVHPGPVRQLSISPAEQTKLLIVYDKGIVVQWNLANKEVDRYPLDPPIKSVNWHFDGRQVLTGNVDGSISLYGNKKSSEPIQRTTPHGTGPCRPIQQVEWKHMSENESIIMFSGGMPTDDGLPMPALTILKGGKSATVLEMDWPIIQFIPLNQNIWNCIPQCPHSVAVLLKHDFMVLDLNQQGHPVIESPHSMNIHESPVTCMAYYSDCPLDLIGALTLVGTKQRNKEFSTRTHEVPVDRILDSDITDNKTDLELTAEIVEGFSGSAEDSIVEVVSIRIWVDNNYCIFSILSHKSEEDLLWFNFGVVGFLGDVEGYIKTLGSFGFELS
ncbi:hypothetical protein GCK72_001283 [Caenorhabditis remanei]|uniref:Lethal giant larvae homologue 2 domain-containing protein n=1 Tax=Caenorhabditis remanei TaxID=31234 RepID=A0A6A5HRW6_CAERE|nr:hypothetical protein GCK72_001283 [Caenorhabditis remanei]KAF1769466.1 hypothetical protein GCK72_001283 [Caenorhabditis remanei]